jgi:uncharacterized membrane protein
MDSGARLRNYRRTVAPGKHTMDSSARRLLERWRDAALLDAATAERIRAWEASQPSAAHGRLSAIAFGLGGVSLGAAVLLFVAAHWDSLPPASRFGLVLALVAAFHVAAAAALERLPSLATTLHAVGTAALGAGVFLAGQIFNMGGDWPAALLLWAVGAAAGVALLRDWPQVVWTAVLVPLWLAGEWLRAFAPGEPTREAFGVLGAGFTLAALAYLAAPEPGRTARWRAALSYLGAATLLPAAALLTAGAIGTRGDEPLLTPGPPYAFGWALATGLPLATALWLRGRRGGWLLAAIPWAIALYAAAHFGAAHGGAAPALRYAVAAIGAVGLVAFGVRERRALLVNLGILAFALTVVDFYFSNVFDRLGRAAGLAGLGLTFIAGGWLLARVRRDLIARIRSPAP